MSLRHFLVTIPLNTVVLTIYFYYIAPWLGTVLTMYEMLALILGVNFATTVTALVLVKDGKRRGRRK